MTIQTGDRVPSATIFKMGDDGGPEASTRSPVCPSTTPW